MAEKQKTYDLDGNVYHLHYTIGRLEQIEQLTGCSVASIVMDALQKKMPSISLLVQLFAYGMFDDSGAYAPPKKAAEFAGKELENIGYSELFLAVFEQLQEDCGFLFR